MICSPLLRQPRSIPASLGEQSAHAYSLWLVVVHLALTLNLSCGESQSSGAFQYSLISDERTERTILGCSSGYHADPVPVVHKKQSSQTCAFLGLFAAPALYLFISDGREESTSLSGFWGWECRPYSVLIKNEFASILQLAAGYIGQPFPPCRP